MRDRPIIFSAPMVRALLEGRKTQTRRITYRPDEWVMAADGTPVPKPTPWVHVKPGDRLWVRESYAVGHKHHAWGSPIYRATFGAALKPVCEGFTPWRSPIHMPRWASRITLHVEAVRVERLQDISEEDACEEGAPHLADSGATPWTDGFAYLWNSLHGADAWDANPEVVALQFRVERKNIDAA